MNDTAAGVQSPLVYPLLRFPPTTHPLPANLGLRGAPPTLAGMLAIADLAVGMPSGPPRTAIRSVGTIASLMDASFSFGRN